MKKIIPIVLSLIFSPFAYSDPTISRESLLGLERTTVDRIRDAGVFGDRDEIRDRSIRDRGFQMGAQYGYIKGIQVMQDKLEKMSDEIDRLYNFSYLMSMSSDSSA